MNINEILDIVLITYNRKDCLQRTFEQIFADNSPIKDFEITVLDNASTDGTSEFIEHYCKLYPNLKHIRNKINIGGCANTAKALIEVPEKKYIWVLCDNDDFDFTAWNEVETAAENDFDVIFTRCCKDTPADIFYKATLVPACVYKTSLITPTVAENIYDEISSMFPHAAVISKILNEKGRVYFVSKDIVISGINPEHNSTFTRGLEKEYIPKSRREIMWSVGYFNTTELITDDKIRYEIIDGARHYHKSLFDLFKTFMIKNKVLHNNYFNNFYRIFRMLNFGQRLKFISAFLIINISFKNYRFYDIRETKDWLEYFDTIKEQKYLDNLAKKLKNKRILLYGAGMIAEVLLENYDLSKFNIAGISDKRFERTGEKEFHSLKAIKPDEIDAESFDAILFCMKLYKKPAQTLKANGINKKMFPAVKPSYFYAVRT